MIYIDEKTFYFKLAEVPVELKKTDIKKVEFFGLYYPLGVQGIPQKRSG